MIDDKKIEEIARYYCYNRYPASQDAPFIAEGFRHGAKWAINEFLKDLWHPSSEKPKPNDSYIFYEYKACNKIYFRTVIVSESVINWEAFVLAEKITRWLYIDDLFPKKGGE